MIFPLTLIPKIKKAVGVRFSEQANIPDPNGAFTGGFITLIIMHNYSISTFSSLLYACNTSSRQVPWLWSICLALDSKKKKKNNNKILQRCNVLPVGDNEEGTLRF